MVSLPQNTSRLPAAHLRLMIALFFLGCLWPAAATGTKAAPAFICRGIGVPPCGARPRRRPETVVMGLWDAFKSSPSQPPVAAAGPSAPGKKTATTQQQQQQPGGAPAKPVPVTFLPSKATVQAQPGQTLKQVAVAAKITDIKFGCNSGDCAMCVGKVNGVVGKVCRARVPASGKVTVEAIPKKTTTTTTTSTSNKKK